MSCVLSQSLESQTLFVRAGSPSVVLPAETWMLSPLKGSSDPAVLAALHAFSACPTVVLSTTPSDLPSCAWDAEGLLCPAALRCAGACSAQWLLISIALRACLEVPVGEHSCLYTLDRSPILLYQGWSSSSPELAASGGTPTEW